VIADYRRRLAEAGEHDKPVMQSLYVDLSADPEEPPTPIHLGFRCGARALTEHLRALQVRGVNHVALNLRFNRASIEDTLERLAAEVMPSLADRARVEPASTLR